MDRGCRIRAQTSRGGQSNREDWRIRDNASSRQLNSKRSFLEELKVDGTVTVWKPTRQYEIEDFPRQSSQTEICGPALDAVPAIRLKTYYLWSSHLCRARLKIRWYSAKRPKCIPINFDNSAIVLHIVSLNMYWNSKNQCAAIGHCHC